MPIYWGSAAHLMKERTATAILLEKANRETALLEAQARAEQARLTVIRTRFEMANLEPEHDRTQRLVDEDRAARREEREHDREVANGNRVSGREDAKADRELK